MATTSREPRTRRERERAERAKPRRVRPAERWRENVNGEGRLSVNLRQTWLPLSALFVDYHESVIHDDEREAMTLQYQRRRDAIAERIGREFDPDLFLPLIVNERQDGRYAIVDGGSRFRGLVEYAGMDDDVLVPCLVYQWDDQREIRNFLGMNEERRGLTQVDKFIAHVQLGDEPHVKINNLLIEHAGIGVRRGGWQAVEALLQAHGRGNLDKSLRIMGRIGWLDHPKGRNMTTINSMSLVLAQPMVGDGERFNERRAVSRWSGLDPRGLAADAKALADTRAVTRGSRSLGKVGALVLARAYNYRLPDEKRIDASFLVAGAVSEDDDE